MFIDDERCLTAHRCETTATETSTRIRHAERGGTLCTNSPAPTLFPARSTNSLPSSQVKGPYRRWWHTHSFRAVDGGTEVIDHVEYSLPGGPLGHVMHALLTKRQLKTIFDYRFQVIEELFPAR